MSDGFTPPPGGSHWGPATHALTFGLSAATFLGTVGHALQSVLYAMAAMGAFCGGVASLGQLIRGWRQDRGLSGKGGKRP